LCNKFRGDALDESVIDRRVDEILAAQGLTRAVIEERMNSAARAIRGKGWNGPLSGS
jgi:hypothetical protein